MDRKFLMNLDKKKILDYLVSTFDDYFRSRQREHENKMVEAKGRLEIIEERETFLSGIARDLQTPLSCTDETLELLLDGGFGDLQADQADVIRNLRYSNQAILNMVKELMDIYRGTPMPTPGTAPAASISRKAS